MFQEPKPPIYGHYLDGSTLWGDAVGGRPGVPCSLGSPAVEGSGDGAPYSRDAGVWYTVWLDLRTMS